MKKRTSQTSPAISTSPTTKTTKLPFFQNLIDTIQRHKVESILIAGLILVSLLTRLYKLDQIPGTLTHDETVYAIQARSLAVQGKTWDQKLGWFSLQPVDPMYAEWPASLIAPFFWLTSNPLLAVHLPSAVMGAVIPFLLGLVVFDWYRNRRLSLWVVTVAVFNPFLWEFSRLAYDGVYSVFFYLLGTVILLYLPKYWKLLSLPVFLFGFFQYQGLKLLLVPWVLAMIALHQARQLELDFNKPKQVVSQLFQRARALHSAEILVAVAVIILTLVYGLVLLPKQNVNDRLRFMVWNDQKLLGNFSHQVDVEHRLSFTSPLTKVFSNKVTVVASYMIVMIFSVFDPRHLFLYLSATVNGFAVWQHGLFYVIDGVLLLVGVYALFRRRSWRLTSVGLVGLIFVSMVPALINTMSDWPELRAILTYTLLSVVIGAGLYLLTQNRILRWIVLGIYAVSISFFSFQYFTRYPIYSADFGHYTDRLLSSYVVHAHQAHPDQPIIVYVHDGGDIKYLFQNYLLYSREFTSAQAPQISADIQKNIWRVGNVEFKSGCIRKADVGAQTLIRERDGAICEDGEVEPKTKEVQPKVSLPQTFLSLAAISDSNELFRIHNDKLCQGVQTPGFLHPRALRQFALEKLSDTEFCQTWVITPNRVN